MFGCVQVKSPAGKENKINKRGGGCEEEKVEKDVRDERDGAKRGDLPHAFMDNCVCFSTSQHARLCHSGQNWPAAPNQPWPFTTLPWGGVCSTESVCTFVFAVV